MDRFDVVRRRALLLARGETATCLLLYRFLASLFATSHSYLATELRQPLPS